MHESVFALATWASILVLGPLATAIFIWFIIDARRTGRRIRERREGP